MSETLYKPKWKTHEEEIPESPEETIVLTEFEWQVVLQGLADEVRYALDPELRLGALNRLLKLSIQNSSIGRKAHEWLLTLRTEEAI